MRVVWHQVVMSHCDVKPELVVSLQQVTQSIVKLLLLHEGATFLMEPHRQDQGLASHTHTHSC